MFRIKTLWLLILGIFILGCSLCLATATVEQGKERIRALGKEAINILVSSELSDEQLQDKMAELYKRSFALEKIASMVLGPRYWREMSPDQQKRFLNLFPRVLAKIYAANFKEYRDNPFEFNVKGGRKNGQVITINSQLIKPNATTNVEWLLTLENKPFDIIISGISMLSTYHAEYTSILEKDSIDNFLNSLEELLGR